MGVKITDIVLDKKTYLYGIDKNINISFKLNSDNKPKKIKEIYIYYGFNVICHKEKHFIDSKKIIIDSNIILNEEKQYTISVPIVVPNEKSSSTKISNFLYIKCKNPNIKEEVKTKIYFSVKKYESHGIKNIINYSGITNYILSNNFEKESKDDIKMNIDKHSSIEDNHNQLDNNNKVLLKTKFFSFSTYEEKDYIDRDLLNSIIDSSIVFKILHFLLHSKIYKYIYTLIILVPILMISTSIGLLIIFESSYSKYSYIGGYGILMLFGAIIFLWINKNVERNYKDVLYNTIYDIKLHSSKTISNNINNKFKTGKLDIYDFFERFNIKGISSSIDYRFSVRLDTFLESHYGTGKHARQEVNNLNGIELFNDSGNKIFEISNLKLVQNDYSKIYDIIIPAFNKGWMNGVTKTYHKLAIDFSSSYLPDYKKELNINLDKKLTFSFINLNLGYIIIIFIGLIILFSLIYLISYFD